jgi:hypothetical protein
MGKLLIWILLFAGLSTGEFPKDITGKWVVENVDISKYGKLTQQQMELMKKNLIKPLTNAVFDCETNHQFHMAAQLGNMPQNNSWDYDQPNGLIKISQNNNPKSLIMEIKVLEKNGSIYFYLAETNVILKMQKR